MPTKTLKVDELAYDPTRDQVELFHDGTRLDTLPCDDLGPFTVYAEVEFGERRVRLRGLLSARVEYKPLERPGGGVLRHEDERVVGVKC